MDPKEIIVTIIGFFLLCVMAPIGLTYVAQTNSTFNATGTAATYSAVFTIFSVLFPVMFMIGAALHFIPKLRGD